MQPGVLAVATLRKEAVKQAQAELARAQAQLSEAEAAWVKARAELARSTVPERPNGKLSGAALQRAFAYVERRQAEQGQLERALERREGALIGARARSERARDALREAHIAAQLVDRHLDRRAQEQRRWDERRAEDDDDDRRLPS